MQRVLLIGYGFMGKTHSKVYSTLPGAEVVGVVDPRGEGIRDSLRAEALGDVAVFEDFAAAVESVNFSVADICLPTDLHRDVALQSFAAGKHVFCEKPIALTRADAVAMTSSGRVMGKQFMVGHCIRFWPEYVELKRLVDSGERGALQSLSLTRRTGRPSYSVGDWVNDPGRCLGAALDLHIHDVDFLLHLLGGPQAVVSQGVCDASGWSSLSTQYIYDACCVTAEGSWNYPTNWGFQMSFSAVFEQAALDFDSRQGLTLTPSDGAPRALKVAPEDGYHNELAYFIGCLESGVPVEVSTGEQATASLELVLSEIESAGSGKRITISN